MKPPMRPAPCVVLLVALSVACGGSPAAEALPAAAEPATAAPSTPAAAPAPEATPAAPPSDHLEDAAFELRLAPGEGGYAAGKLGSFALTLKPRGAWHINQDFPTSVRVRGAPELAFPNATLAKAAAAEFGDTSARFDVPFTASTAGTHTAICDVKFAVCSEENCVPEERTLALALTVN